ncbi:Sulf-transp domain-containing protein [Mycena kentingensis (nom. inval.)]|nr:Sulf-transp domain-containing protein [Mycena kentingensis (nom. inval.)]
MSNALLGGLGLTIAAHSRLRAVGRVFGISGIFHRALRGNTEDLASVFGLLLGGIVAGLVQGNGAVLVASSLSRIVVSGALVGIGTKLANGCTSGHMLCGTTRFSPRSIVATATFFLTGALTAQVVYGNALLGTSPPPPTWTFLDPTDVKLLALQSIPILVSGMLYIFSTSPRPTKTPGPDEPKPSLRILASATTSFQFALALRLSSLTEPLKVIAFLLPFHEAFDGALAYLALGALPAGAWLYAHARGNEKPWFGGAWSVPMSAQIDAQLVLGSAIFGVGWGLAGICPGPGIVNLGRAMANSLDLTPFLVWLGAFALGGFVV